MNIGVLDYGVGNLGSVLRALEELRVKATLIDRAIDAHHADALILPGVGGFTDCKRILDKGGWTDAIREEVISYKKPLLGICLGMQLLADSSEEGASQEEPTEGLRLIPGNVVSLMRLGCTSRIPHVGWNSISMKRKHSLFVDIPEGTDFYFVHSYAFVPKQEEALIAVTDYGVEVPVAVVNGNVWGTQFHPEKSSRAGFRLLQNFILGNRC